MKEPLSCAISMPTIDVGGNHSQNVWRRSQEERINIAVVEGGNHSTEEVLTMNLTCDGELTGRSS